MGYQLQLVEDNESICWRDSQLWSIKPRNPDRDRLFKVWVDSETGILLRVEIKGQRNQWLSFLTQIQFDPQSISEEVTQYKTLKTSDKKQEYRFVSRSEAEKALQRELILPERRNNLRKEKISDVHVTIMDRADVHIYRWTDDSVNFTLIGSLPESEMAQIVESFINNP